MKRIGAVLAFVFGVRQLIVFVGLIIAAFSGPPASDAAVFIAFMLSSGALSAGAFYLAYRWYEGAKADDAAKAARALFPPSSCKNHPAADSCDACATAVRP